MERSFVGSTLIPQGSRDISFSFRSSILAEFLASTSHSHVEQSCPGIEMKTKRIFLLLICSVLLISSAYAASENTDPAWRVIDLPFHALNIASDGTSLWVCGTDEGIAVSSDAGVHWTLKHHTRDGNVLLNIQFANSKFGYAAGTGGALFITEDGGQTWTSRSAGKDEVLQISFPDPQHGFIRTRTSLLFTSDGGDHWSSVDDNSGVLSRFQYPFSLVALDSKHFAVMLKQGSAQYEPQIFLTTCDGGKSWQVVDIPSTTLYSFIRTQDKYWAIGTEVIDKNKPGGGHAVPVALYSSDGSHWSHSTADLSACRSEMCVACTGRGCLSSNGVVVNVYSQVPSYWSFSPNPKLTSKWAATPSAICFVGSALQCTGLKNVARAVIGQETAPGPVAVSPGPLNNSASQGPQCVSCSLDRIIVDRKIQGTFVIKLTLVVGKNGTVMDVDVGGAPTQEITSRIKQQVQQWLFEPYVVNGSPVAIKVNFRTQVNVLRSR